MEEWVNLIHRKRGKMDLWVEDWVDSARDRVHNLDLNIPEHQDIYHQHVTTFIMFNEVKWDDEDQVPTKPKIKLKVYDDTATPPNKTIGFGFNMDAAGARKEWLEVFGDKVSFDKVKKGLKITKEQAKELLDYQIKKRRDELELLFGKDWKLLKPNEKMAIESLYFNSPSLVRKGTKFHENIKKYIETNDPKYLKETCNEVKYKSNKNRHPGIQYRRDKEARMLESNKCPIYSKPLDDLIPKGASMDIKLGKTVVPRSQPNTPSRSNRRYYIWRSQQDDKVRVNHQFCDGKIFDVDSPPDIGHPGKDYNCRCIQDFNIPDFVNLKLSDEKTMVRKYVDLPQLPNFCIK
ncbi:phage minor head protein [Candidatus Phycorickettsia trachydisci]|nr:phage minor head protein [Candidatus Phycorickettsia trachydisci]